ncbi:hypothetical protein PENTCL1PPCAC_17351, partial [Pristionchus entomophagus]
TKLSDGLSAFFPLKNEEMTTVDTATNSSCASSPQKASPMGSTSSPVMEVNGGDETPPLSFSSAKCGGCEDSAARIAQLEAQLETTQRHLNTANALLAFRLKQEMVAPPPPMLSSSLFSSLSSMGRSPSIPSFLTPSNLQSLLVNLQ